MPSSCFTVDQKRVSKLTPGTSPANRPGQEAQPKGKVGMFLVCSQSVGQRLRPDPSKSASPHAHTSAISALCKHKRGDWWRSHYRRAISALASYRGATSATRLSLNARSTAAANTSSISAQAGGGCFSPCALGRTKRDRKWRDLDRAMHLLRKHFGYRGAIPIYLHGDPELAKYRALGTKDGAVALVSPSTPEHPVPNDAITAG